MDLGNRKEVIRLEISKEDNKATVAAILVMDGYTVHKTKVLVNGKNKYVLEAWKDEERKQC